MSGHRKLGIAAISVALVFIVGGCGGSDAGDKIAEKIAEENGGDVDIDSDSGKISYTDEEGNETDIDVGGSAEVPDDWPEDLAPPDSVKIISSGTNTVSGKQVMTLIGEAEGSVDDFVDPLKAQIEDAGYEIVDESTADAGGMSYASITAKSDDFDLVAGVTEGADDGTVSISMSLSEPQT